MKVEQKKEFAPITITLETFEEALTMWGCLNVSRDDLMKNLAGVSFSGYACSQHMWADFNSVFPLTKLKPKK